MNEKLIDKKIKKVLGEGLDCASAAVCPRGCMPIPLEISARHVHLTEDAIEKLFGKGAQLGNKRNLSQPGEFLSDKRVKLVTRKGELTDVAVLGPARKSIQVEISSTDCRALGIKAPVNMSGDLSGAAGIMIIGDRGTLDAKGSVIIAKAHIHMTPANADSYKVKDGQRVSVVIKTVRPVTLDDVVIRVRENFALALHIDADESSACCATANDKVVIVGREESACDQRDTLFGCGTPVSNEGFISEDDARKMLKRGSPLIFAKGTLVTPSAMDVFVTEQMDIRFE